MKCNNCSFYHKTEKLCIKMKEGLLSELEGDCLLRNILSVLISIHEDIMGEKDND